jgi:type IV secretory pathway TraG/TraD family ATPase VirD4
MLMSDGGGRGMSTWAFVQSFAQLRARWGRDGADSIWGASSIKLLLGGCTEADDLEKISRVVGDRRVQRQSHTNPGGLVGRKRIVMAGHTPAIPACLDQFHDARLTKTAVRRAD